MSKEMKDKQISEEKILDDLDTKYQRVTDIEKEEAAEASMHTKEKPKPKKKRSSRPIIIVALIVFIILAVLLAFPFLKQMITPLLPKTSKTPPPFVATPPVPKAKPSAPLPVPKKQESIKTPLEVEKPKPIPPAPVSVLKEQEPIKTVPEEVKKTKPIPKEITKPSKPLTQEKYYTIQIGAFRNVKYARDLLEILKEDGLDAYLTRLEGKKRGTFYKVFVGHFKDEKEGVRFLKEKGILNNYPGSFIRKAPSFEVHQLIEGKISL